jgi:hypothetical protein
VEWTAQFILRDKLAIDTARFDPTCLPEGEVRSRLASRAGETRTVPIGLFDSLAVLRTLLPDHPLACRLNQRIGGTTPLARLQQWIERRNTSILAHGFTPVDESLWTEAHDWVNSCWLPWLFDELASRNQDLPQFPQTFPL